MPTDAQLLEILKIAAWQQSVIGLRAAWEVREALRIDDTPPPHLSVDRPFGHADDSVMWGTHVAPQPGPRDLVDKPSFNRPAYGVWGNTQLLLSAAANVSKLLWPPRRDNQRHCEDLRRLLDVDDSSPLADRSLRDGFEHFGERILTWADSRLGERYSDTPIFTAEVDLPLPPPIRAFLEEDFAVILLGQKYELQPIVAALRGVADRGDPAAGLHL